MKFDGYCVQVHKVGSRVVIYSRNGHDFTERFPSIAQQLQELPAKAAVLDGEVVASNADGSPNFARLHVRWARPGTIHLWAFDLLMFNGRDLRLQPLVKRQTRLQALLDRFGCAAVSLSEPFEDGLALLRVAEDRGLEGIVSKHRDAPYRSGECRTRSSQEPVDLRAAPEFHGAGKVANQPDHRGETPAVDGKTPYGLGNSAPWRRRSTLERRARTAECQARVCLPN